MLIPPSVKVLQENRTHTDTILLILKIIVSEEFIIYFANRKEVYDGHEGTQEGPCRAEHGRPSDSSNHFNGRM